MPQDDSFKSDLSYITEALKLQYNWITLVGIAGFALVSGSALPLLLGAGLELMYLSVVPQNPRFQRLVRSWKLAEEQKEETGRLLAMFQEMTPEIRLRYADVDKIASEIRQNYLRLSSASQMFAPQMEERLQVLLKAYLRLLHAAWQHREYLRTTDIRRVESELQNLQKSAASDAARVQEINRKRIDILEKRIEKFKKIRETRDVIDAQCAAVQDVLGLLRDQSVTMHNPQQLTDHLDGLVRDVEHTEDSVREIESIFESVPDSIGILPSSEIVGSSTTPKNRVRN